MWSWEDILAQGGECLALDAATGTQTWRDGHGERDTESRVRSEGSNWTNKQKGEG